MMAMSSWAKMAVEAIVLLRRIDHRLKNIEDLMVVFQASVTRDPSKAVEILGHMLDGKETPNEQ